MPARKTKHALGTTTTKLTAARIAAMQPGETLYDSEVSGLWVRAGKAAQLSQTVQPS